MEHPVLTKAPRKSKDTTKVGRYLVMCYGDRIGLGLV